MKRTLAVIAAAVLIALPGCATLPTAPRDVAQRTVLDERGAIAAETAYAAFRTALEVAVDAGALRGEAAARAAAADRRAYLAVTAVRGAYRLGNAADYTRLQDEADAIIRAALAAIKGA